MQRQVSICEPRERLSPPRPCGEAVGRRKPDQRRACGGPAVTGPVNLGVAQAFEGRLTCGVAETPLGKTLLASVHPGTGHVAESYLQGFDLRAARRPSAPEAYYTDLIFLGLEELRAMYHCPFIFGGDWMESLLLPGWKRRTRDFFDRASGHGWVDTTHRLHGEGHEMRTWCKPGQRPYQNDRIHVDASTAHNLVSCQASDCRDIADISDHAPVLVVLST